MSSWSLPTSATANVPPTSISPVGGSLYSGTSACTPSVSASATNSERSSRPHPNGGRLKAAFRICAVDPAPIVAYPRPRDTPPHRGGPIWKGRHDDDAEARHAAGNAAFLLRPLRQAPRVESSSPDRCPPGTLAPIEDRQGEAQSRHRSYARDPRGPGRLPHRHCAGLRYRCSRDGVAVAAWRTAGHGAGLGI